MQKPTIVTLDWIDARAKVLAGKLVDEFGCKPLKVHGVPRGGIPAALAVLKHHQFGSLVDDPKCADVIIDDIIDSGRTRDRVGRGKLFMALVDKTKAPFIGRWVVMPWEVTDKDTSADDIVIRLLQLIGEDPSREGLQETPARVIKAWQEWGRGYGQDPAKVLKTFEDGADSYDELVFQGNIPFFSTCEHHLAPFFGVAHIAYIPNGRVVGLSKLSRLVDIYSRRLQCQERITTQVADAMTSCLEPLGVGVVLQARHLCMESRGICKIGATTTTSALRGALKENPDTRAEFMAFVQSS